MCKLCIIIIGRIGERENGGWNVCMVNIKWEICKEKYFFNGVD